MNESAVVWNTVTEPDRLLDELEAFVDATINIGVL